MSFYSSQGSYPDSITITPLDYKRPSQNSEGISLCMLVGLAAVVMYLTSNQTSNSSYYGPQRRHRYPLYPHRGAQMVSGMAATVVEGVKKGVEVVAEAATVVTGTKKEEPKVDVSEVYTDVPSTGLELLDARDVVTTGNIMAFQHMEATEREELKEKFMNWLQTHENAIIMIFAPWCPHCKQAMPILHQLMLASQEDDIHFVVVNAEAFPAGTFTEGADGEAAFIKCEYFPTFVAKNGQYIKIAPNMNKAKDLALQELDQVQKANHNVETALNGMIDEPLPEEEELDLDTLF